MRIATRLAMLGALVLSLSAAIADEIGDQVTLIRTPNRGQPVVARTDAAGTIHLVYATSGVPQYVKSEDKGKTFSTPLAIVNREARKPGLEFQVWDMVVGAGGRVHVAIGTNAWKLKL